MHDGGKIINRLRIVQIITEGRLAHQQMLAHQPADGFGFLRGQAKSRADLKRQLGAKLGMVAVTALGDIMEKCRHKQGAPRFNLRHYRGCHRRRPGKAATLDLVENADNLDGVLIDGIAVIHVELHHRDDLAEIGEKTAKHTALVHQAKNALRIVLRCQNGKELLGRARIIPGRIAKRVKTTRDPLQSLRMNVGLLFQRQMEYLQHPQRRLTEHQLGIKVDSAGADAEMPEILTPPEFLGPAKATFAKIGFHRRADDAGQVSNVARRKIIPLHEAFDIAHAATRGKSHQRGNRHLGIEIQPLLGSARAEVKMASDSPQEALRGGKAARLAFAQNALVDNVDDAVGAIGEFRDPEQRVKIAQSALAFLDIGLNDITRGTLPVMALIPLLELGIDEIHRLEARHLTPERAVQLSCQRPVAGDEPHFEKPCQDCLVLSRGTDRIRHRPFCMTNLEPKVPQQIEQRLDNNVGGRVVVIRRQKQKVDIGIRCQLTAAIPANGDKRDTGRLMALHKNIEKACQKLIHAKRMAADIDSAITPGGQLVGKPGFHRRMRRPCRGQQRRPEGFVIGRLQIIRHLPQGSIVKRRLILGKRRLERLNPLSPLLDLAAACTRGRCGIRSHTPLPNCIIFDVVRRRVEKVAKFV